MNLPRPVRGSLCLTQSIMALVRTMLPHHKEIIIVPNCLVPLVVGLLVDEEMFLESSYRMGL